MTERPSSRPKAPSKRPVSLFGTIHGSPTAEEMAEAQRPLPPPRKKADSQDLESIRGKGRSRSKSPREHSSAHLGLPMVPPRRPRSSSFNRNSEEEAQLRAALSAPSSDPATPPSPQPPSPAEPVTDRARGSTVMSTPVRAETRAETDSEAVLERGRSYTHCGAGSGIDFDLMNDLVLTVEDASSSSSSSSSSVPARQPNSKLNNLMLAIQEILSTEVTFLFHMKQLRRGFMDQLKDKNTQWAQQVRDQFVELALGSVVETSDMLMREFQAFINPEEKVDWSKSDEQILEELEAKVETLCKVFIKYAPFLRVFVPFCNKYEQTLKNLTRIQQNSNSFSDYLEERKQEIGLPLESLLIMPVQRIMRYPILLGGVKSTLPKDKTYPLFDKCTAEIQMIVAQVNLRQKDGENRTHVLNIQNSLLDTPSEFSLVAPNRLYLSECRINYSKTVRKQRGVEAPPMKEKKERLLILFNDAILITKQRRRLRSGNTTQMYYRAMLRLGDEVKFYRCPSTNRIEVVNNRLNLNEIHIFAFSSEEEKQNWLKKFEEVAPNSFIPPDTTGASLALFNSLTTSQRKKKEEQRKKERETLLKTPSTEINPLSMGLASVLVSGGNSIRLRQSPGFLRELEAFHKNESSGSPSTTESPTPPSAASPSPAPPSSPSPSSSSSSSSSSSAPHREPSPIPSSPAQARASAHDDKYKLPPVPPPPELFIPVPPEFEDNPRVQELVQSIHIFNKKTHNMRVMTNTDFKVGIERDAEKCEEMFAIIELLQDKYGPSVLDPILSNYNIFRHGV